jgi:hypothetical protein
MIWKTILVPACLLFMALSLARAQNNYASLMSAATQHCEKIDPNESQSGLIFNPDGYRSYYAQSECFQNAAVQYRNISLCDRVRRRRSLFFSSWGISAAQCRKLVTEGIAADRAELQKEKQAANANPIRMRTFRIERNGNGRDYDIVPVFSDGSAHGYRLVYEILRAGQQPIMLQSNGYYVDPNANLRLFVRQADIRSRFPGFQPGSTYNVRATMIFSIGMGGPSGYWSDEFVESIFPLRERTQSITIESRF